MDKNKLDKWIRWIEIIYDECENLKIKSYFYREYLEIVKNNLDIASPRDFHDWVAHNYYEATLMNIRRLIDDHKDTISLKNLLTEIIENPSVIAKEWYLSFYKNTAPTSGDSLYSAGKHFIDVYTEDNDGISVAKIQTDIIKLDNVEKKLSSFVDNTLAHRNKGEKGKQSVKTREIEDAILEVEKIMIKYLDLFNKGGFVTLEPTWTYDWQIIFTKPWII